MTTGVRIAGAAAVPSRTDRVRVTLSDRHEDVDAALRLMHDGFVASGFLRPRASGRRMIAPFLNPGTTFALARVDGVLRGTVAVIADGPFGLPCERAFAEEISGLRAGGVPVFEIGSLALDADATRLQGPVMWALVAAVLRLQREEHPDAPGVVAVSPTAERFYRSVVGLRALTPPRPLLGTPAILMQTTAREAADDLIGGGGGRHRMARLVHGSAMSWLRDRRDGAAWPAAWLEPLLDEIDPPRRLTASARLVPGDRRTRSGAWTRPAVAAPA